KKAINELNNNNITFNSKFNDYVLSDKTYINGDVLYYKNISEGLMLLNALNEDETITFNDSFKTFGTMLDLSRGAVYKVSYLKNLIRKQAIMGANEIWLYMEDVYEVEGYPFFGYLRGKYSKEELKEVVAYAEIFGITLVPAIQTLGHMEQFLKWHDSRFVKDQYHVLLAEDDRTYELIKAMFKTIREVFKTDRIHIGLDETFGLGFGRYYKENGYKHQYDIFLDHLERVNTLALEMGFKDVLIWSDMFYRISSKHESYYDPETEFSNELLARIPKNVGLVYWDYYNTNLELVTKMLKSHKKMGRKVIMASGTWTWVKFTYDKNQSDKTANIHIEASKAEGIDEFILTQWGDDGAYVDHETSLLGVYELGLKALTNNKPNAKAYENITNELYSDALLKTKLNDATINPQGLMWDDPLLGIYVNNYVGNDYQALLPNIKQYETIVEQLKANDELLFTYHIASANLYKLKARYTMLNNYFNKKPLIEAKPLFDEFKKHIKEIAVIFDNIWHDRNKLIGLEAIQSRFATQLVRADEMTYIMENYDSGKIEKIEAFEDEVGATNQLLSLKFIGLGYSMRPY
ncbi:MAG TPA: beta-N-acetylhexosaminidase, partial [Acholeplasmataceae bacterium]|nr:beta-N-acetylhexosaminidase [Acholeplasmataceae bacterium]